MPDLLRHPRADHLSFYLFRTFSALNIVYFGLIGEDRWISMSWGFRDRERRRTFYLVKGGEGRDLTHALVSRCSTLGTGWSTGNAI